MNPLFKILFVGDLHLGHRLYGLDERVRDHAAVLPQINDYVDEHQPDVLVLGGDVFNAPNVDSYSCDAFRRFVERVSFPIRIIALTGNHDRERLNLGVTRVQSLGGERLEPAGGTLSLGIGHEHSLQVEWFDWRPAAEMSRTLAALPDGQIDVLCLHQSIEGLLPGVATPEVRLEQLAGKARLVLAGDVHLNRHVHAGPDTLVVSAGPTEACALDQLQPKVVKLITYDVAAHQVVAIEDLPLRTRPFVSWLLDEDAAVDGLLSQIHEGDWDSVVPDYNGIAPLIILDYLPALAHRVPELERAAAQSDCLLHARPQATVEVQESFVDSKLSAETEMETILAGRFDDGAERDAALALWRNPDNLDAVLASLI